MNDIDKYLQLFHDLWFNISEGEIVKIVSNMDALGNLLFQKYLTNPQYYGNEKMNQDGSHVLPSLDQETDG